MVVESCIPSLLSCAFFINGELSGNIQIEFNHPVSAIIRVVADDLKRRDFVCDLGMVQMAWRFAYDKGWLYLHVRGDPNAIGLSRR